MYVDISVLHRGSKTYTRALLRESYREGGKVKHRTIANISKCSLEEIEAIQLALRHKDALGNLGSIKKAIKLTQGKSRIGNSTTFPEVSPHLPPIVNRNFPPVFPPGSSDLSWNPCRLP